MIFLWFVSIYIQYSVLYSLPTCILHFMRVLSNMFVIPGIVYHTCAHINTRVRMNAIQLYNRIAGSHVLFYVYNRDIFLL